MPEVPSEFGPLVEAIGGDVAKDSIISYTGSPLMSPPPWRQGRSYEQVKSDWIQYGKGMGEASLDPNHPCRRPCEQRYGTSPLCGLGILTKTPFSMIQTSAATFPVPI